MFKRFNLNLEEDLIAEIKADCVYNKMTLQEYVTIIFCNHLGLQSDKYIKSNVVIDKRYKRAEQKEVKKEK